MKDCELDLYVKQSVLDYVIVAFIITHKLKMLKPLKGMFKSIHLSFFEFSFCHKIATGRSLGQRRGLEQR